MSICSTCGGLMMATKRSVPNMPRLEMLKEPPMNSSGFSLLARALAASSRTCRRSQMVSVHDQ